MQTNEFVANRPRRNVQNPYGIASTRWNLRKDNFTDVLNWDQWKTIFARTGLENLKETIAEKEARQRIAENNSQWTVYRLLGQELRTLNYKLNDQVRGLDYKTTYIPGEGYVAWRPGRPT